MSRITRSVSARMSADTEPVSAPIVTEPMLVITAEPVVPEPAPAVPEPAPAVPAVPAPAPAAPEPKDSTQCEKFKWLVSMTVSGADDDVEIREDKCQLYIIENYIDKANNKKSQTTKVTPTLLKSWLKLWFRSLRMDTHPKWTGITVYFSLMPAISTVRADLTKHRAYDLIHQIRNAVDFHIDLSAGNK